MKILDALWLFVRIVWRFDDTGLRMPIGTAWRISQGCMAKREASMFEPFEYDKNYEYKYYFAWGNNPKRATLKGRRCALICRGEMNSCMIQFEDGKREIVSRNAIRKVRDTK